MGRAPSRTGNGGHDRGDFDAAELPGRSIQNPYIGTERRLKRHFFQILLTSALLTASFPPLRSGFLVCIALVPFLLMLEDGHSLKNAFGSGYLTGFCSRRNAVLDRLAHRSRFVGVMLYLPCISRSSVSSSAG